MKTEFDLPKMISAKISAAYRVHPDFRITSLGANKKNDWTEFADRRLLFEPNMEKGLTRANYQNWLDWSYEMFAIDDADNPITRRIFDLEDDNREIAVLWAMSFKEKGFTCSKRIDTPTVKFRRSDFIDKKTKELSIVEKELIADRFGNPTLVQRRYSDGCLVELVTLTSKRPDSNVLIMRLDNPKIPGYKQWYSNFIVGWVDELNSFINVGGDISSHLFKTRRLQASYTI